MRFLICLVVLIHQMPAFSAISCIEYAVSNDQKIVKLCARSGRTGNLTYPELISENGVAWPVSVGLFVPARAKKLCQLFGFESLTSFERVPCPMEQAGLNLKASYSNSRPFVYGTGECFESLQCE